MAILKVATSRSTKGFVYLQESLPSMKAILHHWVICRQTSRIGSRRLNLTRLHASVAKVAHVLDASNTTAKERHYQPLRLSPPAPTQEHVPTASTARSSPSPHPYPLIAPCHSTTPTNKLNRLTNGYARYRLQILLPMECPPYRQVLP